MVEFIEAVKDELIRAKDAAGNDPLLELGDVELEMSFVTSKEASGGIHFWVVDVGGNYSKEQVHTLRVRLTPAEKKNPKTGKYERKPLPMGR